MKADAGKVGRERERERERERASDVRTPCQQVRVPMVSSRGRLVMRPWARDREREEDREREGDGRTCDWCSRRREHR